MSTHVSDHTHGEEQPVIDETCGYTAGSFACRIRHIQVNTGAAKAANDLNDPAALPSRSPKGIERV